MASSTTNVNVSEVEETLARIKSHKGVEGVVIMTKEGAIIQSSLSEEDSKEHAALLSSLTEKASILVDTLDPDDELNFLRVRSKKKEIMIAPEGSYVLVVIQNPNATID